MVSERGWRNWIAEYESLQDKRDRSDLSLPPDETHRLNHLRNLLEAGMGTKTMLSEDNRRFDLRVPCQIEASIKTDDTTFIGTMHNISTGGIFISCDQSLSHAQQLTIDIEGIDGKIISRTGKVKWVSDKETNEDAGHLPPGAGVRLNPAPAEQDHAFRELVYALLTEKILGRI